MSDCNHKWEHLDTQYLYHSRSFGNATYERIDRFYCSNCCEIKEIVKDECSCYQPDWFDGRNYRTVRG